MKIIVNGKEMEIEDGASVLEMLKTRELSPDAVVVELNKDIVMSDSYGETVLKEGDHLEVLRFVGGG